MRKIRLAKNLGFCLGVRRAVDIVEKTLLKSKHKVYSLGPVIHNPEVIKQLQKKSLRVITSLGNLKESATVILPSHGTPQHILNNARNKKLILIDVTCPYVLLVQKICHTLHSQGLKVIIIGDRNHPEIKTLKSIAKGACIIQNLKEVKEKIFSYKRIGIISQTTQSKDMFFNIVVSILKKNPQILEVRIFNTICLDTIRRQEETEKLAKKVKVLLVVGSRTSANTKRLLSIGRRINPKTYLVETKENHVFEHLKDAKNIGLISGASTPAWLVKEIMQKIKEDEKNDRNKVRTGTTL